MDSIAKGAFIKDVRGKSRFYPSSLRFSTREFATFFAPKNFKIRDGVTVDFHNFSCHIGKMDAK